MSDYRIRITETTISKAEAAFNINAETPQLAATILSAAYNTARATNSIVLVLPDGQRQIIDDSGIVEVSVAFSLLNGDGEVEHEITKAELKRSMT